MSFNKPKMIINHTTGEIAYHSLILKESGGIEFKQYPLKKKEGEKEAKEEGKIEFVYPENWPENRANQ